MSGIGHIGEMFVINEFDKELEMEVYLPLKDTGIDFVALKNNVAFQIQVKTSMFQKNSYFWFDIKKSRIRKKSYFIFVCHTLNRQKFNGSSKNYLIIPAETILDWIEKKQIPNKENSIDVYNIFLYPPKDENNKWLFRNKSKEIDWTGYFKKLDYFK